MLHMLIILRFSPLRRRYAASGRATPFSAFDFRRCFAAMLDDDAAMLLLRCIATCCYSALCRCFRRERWTESEERALLSFALIITLLVFAGIAAAMPPRHYDAFSPLRCRRYAITPCYY